MKFHAAVINSYTHIEFKLIGARGAKLIIDSLPKGQAAAASKQSIERGAGMPAGAA
jgi:hypothetical protein